MVNKHIYHNILYFYFQDYLFSLPKHERIKFSRETFAGKLFNMVLTLLLLFKEKVHARQRMRSEFSSLKGKHWVFVFANNNYDATKFLDDHDVIYVTDRFRKFTGAEKVILLPCMRSFRSYLSFPALIYYLRKREGTRAFKIFDLVFNALGWYEGFDELLRKYRPLSIVFSNDHSVIPRSLFLAAKAHKVPTIYIQHATVTKHFPPLEFDLSLLEGEDAFNKYKRKGIKGEVRLIGMPRFDQYVSMRRKLCGNAVQNLGMAFNTLDSIKRIRSLVSKIISAYPFMRIIIRKHSKDTRDFVTPFADFHANVFFSDACRELPFDFILQCDLLLSGNSSIHLDACLLNVPSFYYDFDGQSKITDLYGFLERGFVKTIQNERTMIDMLKEPFGISDFYLKAKYYNEAVGTHWESKCSQRVKEELKSFYRNLI